MYTYFYSVHSTCFVDICTALHVQVHTVVENNDTPLLDHDILIFFVLKVIKALLKGYMNKQKFIIRFMHVKL